MADLKVLIADNTVHYFMLNGFGGFGGGGFGGGDAGGQSISAYVEGSCTAVPATAWQTNTSGTSTSASTGVPAGFGGGFDRGGGQTLYYCGTPR